MEKFFIRLFVCAGILMLGSYAQIVANDGQHIGSPELHTNEMPTTAGLILLTNTEAMAANASVDHPVRDEAAVLLAVELEKEEDDKLKGHKKWLPGGEYSMGMFMSCMPAYLCSQAVAHLRSAAPVSVLSSRRHVLLETFLI